MAFVAQQRRAGVLVADFLRRATHVDVDDLRARVDIASRGLGHEFRIAARDLHDARLRLVSVVSSTTRFSGIPQARVRGDHFARGERGAEPAAQATERQVGDARHRCEQRVTRERYGPTTIGGGAADVRSDRR